MNDLSHITQAGSEHRPAARVELVSTPAALTRIKPDWDALLKRDPDAGIFLSHDWLAPALVANPDRWRVLVVRDKVGAALCILPLKHRLHWSTSRKEFQTEIEAGGRLGWGEYTGMVCHPDHESMAIREVATYLAALPWKSFSLRYEPTRRRSDQLVEALGDGFTHRFRDYRINKGTTDNLVSPQVPLEGDFDTLMATRISANTRQKIRRNRRKLLESGTYQITVASEGSSERDIALLLANWVAMWSPAKGSKTALDIAERYGRALLTAEAMGALYLPALWQGDRMLGALGHVVDHRRRRVHFLVAGRDPSATDPAIGLLLHAHAIEWATSNGMRIYDFGHGDEAYKFSFGAEPVPSHYLTVRRSGSGPVLDPINLRPALDRLAEFARDGKTDRVARAAAQLAALDPGNPA